MFLFCICICFVLYLTLSSHSFFLHSVQTSISYMPFSVELFRSGLVLFLTPSEQWTKLRNFMLASTTLNNQCSMRMIYTGANAHWQPVHCQIKFFIKSLNQYSCRHRMRCKPFLYFLLHFLFCPIYHERVLHLFVGCLLDVMFLVKGTILLLFSFLQASNGRR